MIRFLSGQTEVFQINALSPLNKKKKINKSTKFYLKTYFILIFSTEDSIKKKLERLVLLCLTGSISKIWKSLFISFLFVKLI